MTENSRDRSILRHILSYCEQIERAADRFGREESTFLQDEAYHNAVSLCILQIGELIGNLTDEFRADHPGIPWRQIKQMRNIVAHRYGTVDHSITWSVVQEDIPELARFCASVIAGPEE